MSINLPRQLVSRRAAYCLAATVLAGAASAQDAAVVIDERTIAAPQASLRGLDTLSGTTRDLDLAEGETVRYGYLELTLEACRVPETDPEGDAFAFLRIRDIREDQPRFSGWMFASSPALSALDHPRYDVWVLSCSSR